MRVAVVGGGVVGLLCAHHLRKRGADVVVLERDRVGQGCSLGNAGWISPSIAWPLPAPGLRLKSLGWMLDSSSPLYIRPSAVPSMAGFLLGFWKRCNRADFDRGVKAFAELGERTMELFDELAEDGVEYEGDDKGLLMVFRERAGLDEELELLREMAYGPIREHDEDELRGLEPALAPGRIYGAHVLPERTVRPETVCAGTAELFVRSGGELLEATRVAELVFEGGRAVAAATEAGESVEADAFLVATGAEAARLARTAGAPLPLQAGKGYSTTVTRPETEIRHPLYLGEAKIGITPFGGAIRVAGTMELSGINLKLDPRRIEALERAAESEVPGVLRGGASERWVGMRPLTPDGLPILGRLPATGNVYVATGHQMLGVTLAPSTGVAMAELILEGASRVDLDPFRPERFAG